MNILGTCITAGFMWEGVKEDDKLLAHYGQGCLELCAEVTQFAELSEMLLDAAFTVIEKDFPSVYDYEVSEPFGAWFRQYMLAADGATPSTYIAASELANRVFQFFARDDNPPRPHEELLALRKALNTARDKWLEARK